MSNEAPSGSLSKGCATCKFRSYAERKPTSIIARLWRWHTGWCPGWRGYQKALAEELRAKEASETATPQDSG